jgi:hypothetical protein
LPTRHISLEGSRGFVISIAAPIDAGWSDPVAGWDVHPLATNAFARRTLGVSPFRSPFPFRSPDNLLEEPPHANAETLQDARKD